MKTIFSFIKSVLFQSMILVTAFVLLGLTAFHVYASELFVKGSCEVLHPIAFDVTVNVLDTTTNERLVMGADDSGLEDETGRVYAVGEPMSIPTSAVTDWKFVADNDFEIPEGGTIDDDREEDWSSCLEYYGFYDSNDFVLLAAGRDAFAPYLWQSPEDMEGLRISTQISLTTLGKIWLYAIMPGYTILLPIWTIVLVKRQRSTYWVLMVLGVAGLVVTSAMVYLEYSTQTGITALSEFGYGIFTGATVGTAIAFMDKVVEYFDRDED